MKIIQQDMLTLTEGILFHQVNCQGVMGGGIAASFATKWPVLEEKYKHFCSLYWDTAYSNSPDELDLTLLGRAQLVKVVTPLLYVCNVFGQRGVSRSRRMTSYDATVEAFEAITHAKHDSYLGYITNSELPLYFPYKMGCGLGGGDWEIYSAIINRYFPDAIICKHDA